MAVLAIDTHDAPNYGIDGFGFHDGQGELNESHQTIHKFGFISGNQHSAILTLWYRLVVEGIHLGDLGVMLLSVDEILLETCDAQLSNDVLQPSKKGHISGRIIPCQHNHERVLLDVLQCEQEELSDGCLGVVK